MALIIRSFSVGLVRPPLFILASQSLPSGSSDVPNSRWGSLCAMKPEMKHGILQLLVYKGLLQGCGAQSPGFWPWSPESGAHLNKVGSGLQEYIHIHILYTYTPHHTYTQYLHHYIGMYICTSLYLYIFYTVIEKDAQIHQTFELGARSPLIWGVGAWSPEPASERSEPGARKMGGTTPLVYKNIKMIPNFIVQRNDLNPWYKLQVEFQEVIFFLSSLMLGVVACGSLDKYLFFFCEKIRNIIFFL